LKNQVDWASEPDAAHPVPPATIGALRAPPFPPMAVKTQATRYAGGR